MRFPVPVEIPLKGSITPETMAMLEADPRWCIIQDGDLLEHFDRIIYIGDDYWAHINNQSAFLMGIDTGVTIE